MTRPDQLPAPLVSTDDIGDLDTLWDEGDVHETPYNVFIGHNLGHRVFAMSVPFRKFYEISDVANDRDAGPVAQRSLDPNHARSLGKYMLKGLVAAAKLRLEGSGKPVSPAFDEVMRQLGEQPYYSIQPIVCNIRSIPLGGTGSGGIRGVRLETKNNETAGFRVFLSERHILWVVDGQHRRKGAEQVMVFLEAVRSSGRYPAKAPIIYPDKGREVTQDEMLVWNAAYDAARSFATLTIEVHLGLNIEQERQLFHDLNKLGKRVNASLALQFDSSNPITLFIKEKLVAELGLKVTESEPRDWKDDEGALALKDVVAVNAIAFLNKSNVSGATPVVVEPREASVLKIWEKMQEIPHFGEPGAKEKTVAAQPVLLKALAKLTYDLNFSNRKPEDSDAQFEKFLDALPNIDFSHSNPLWRYYELSEDEIHHHSLDGLAEFLPPDETGNRDIGSYQSGSIRFGAKHNDIYPILADMVRFSVGLPSRHN